MKSQLWNGFWLMVMHDLKTSGCCKGGGGREVSDLSVIENHRKSFFSFLMSFLYFTRSHCTRHHVMGVG